MGRDGIGRMGWMEGEAVSVKEEKEGRVGERGQKGRVGGSWQRDGLIKSRSFNPVVFKLYQLSELPKGAC